MTPVGPTVPVDFLPMAIFLNRDGSDLVASELFGNRVQLWNTRTGTKVWETDIGTSQGTTLATSPDGRTLALGTRNGAVVLLDHSTGHLLARQLGVPGYLLTSEFSPDGQVLAVGGGDGSVHLFEAGSLRTIGQPLLTNSAWALATFSTDGAQLTAIDERGRVVTWSARPNAWVTRACEVAGRDLTQAEWDTYLPGTPYQRTCAVSSHPV
jgi:WD40 repeat protein